MSELNKNKVKVQINKRRKVLPLEELEQLSKAELIERIVQLEAHNAQLKNILQKKLIDQHADVEVQAALGNGNNKEQPQNVIENSKKIAAKRKFDFSKTHKRHILLKLLYFGWDYQGFACQEDSNATIEHHLFQALTRTCLIESRATSNYHRCGRTDKEVSAYCQVISIDVRSRCPPEQQLDEQALATEIDYCGMLNRVLPSNIQCIAWMPLKSAVYSARFDCLSRTYRYYFPVGDLNIEAMREACQLLERPADFRNFCKMDVHNGVTTFVRDLQCATIHKCCSETNDANGYAMYFLEIKANAFLWHQIRCIMAVLLLIGQGKETPQVINDLLDVHANPCKPQYAPALGLPLNLFQCTFNKRTKQHEQSQAASPQAAENAVHAAADNDAHTTAWVYNEYNLRKLIETVQSDWTRASIKCSMMRDALESLESTFSAQCRTQQSSIRTQALVLQDKSAKLKQYQKLLQRKRCESLENRIEHYVKKQRLVMQDAEDQNPLKLAAL